MKPEQRTSESRLGLSLSLTIGASLYYSANGILPLQWQPDQDGDHVLMADRNSNPFGSILATATSLNSSGWKRFGSGKAKLSGFPDRLALRRGSAFRGSGYAKDQASANRWSTISARPTLLLGSIAQTISPALRQLQRRAEQSITPALLQLRRKAQQAIAPTFRELQIKAEQSIAPTLIRLQRKAEGSMPTALIQMKTRALHTSGLRPVEEDLVTILGVPKVVWVILGVTIGMAVWACCVLGALWCARQPPQKTPEEIEKERKAEYEAAARQYFVGSRLNPTLNSSFSQKAAPQYRDASPTFMGGRSQFQYQLRQ